METHQPGLTDGLAPLWEPGPVGPTRSFLVLPPADDPRLVLPAGRGRAAATVLHALRDSRNAVVKALEKHNGNQTRAAEYLGITRPTLIYRMEKYGLKS